MQNFLGAIDGTHIPTTISPDKAAPFRNRKGTLSQNVMVVCDFDLNITFMSTGWEGSATDARVLRSATNSGFKVPLGKFYLVDGGYANTPSFLAPYRGVRYHLKEYGKGHHRPQNDKDAKQQSGVHFDEKAGRIKACPEVWKNIIDSYPKAKKFRSKGFPLYETLGELYDGQFHHKVHASLYFVHVFFFNKTSLCRSKSRRNLQLHLQSSQRSYTNGEWRQWR